MSPPEPNEDSSTGMGRGMLILAWVFGLGLLTLLMSNVMEQRDNPNQQVQSAVTGAGVREVVLQRNPSGHYVATGFINGRKVVFLLDTGATDVAVSDGLASELGLRRGMSGQSMTANGMVSTWRTTLDTVALGNIRMHRVRASVLPDMPDDQVLLGMSFLKRLEMIQRGDQLTLRQYPGEG